MADNKNMDSTYGPKEAEKYFPYITHKLDHEKFKKIKVVQRADARSVYDFLIGDMFEKESEAGQDSKTFDGGSSALFKSITVRGTEKLEEIVKNPKKVGVPSATHKSLSDTVIVPAVHYNMVNPEINVVVGDNLFIKVPLFGLNFDDMLRAVGGWVFLRKDRTLQMEGLPEVYLRNKDFMDYVLAPYLKKQMIEGVKAKRQNGIEDIVRHDLIMFPESEKNPLTHKQDGGRSKNGYLREVSPIIPLLLYAIQEDSDVELFLEPVDVACSKYIDILFLQPSSKIGKIGQKIPPIRRMKYALDLNYTFNRYPHAAENNPERKIDATITYGKAIPIPKEKQEGMKSRYRIVKNLSEQVREEMSRSATIYPSAFIFRAMGNDWELAYSKLKERMNRLLEFYQEKGVNVSKISDEKGRLLPVKDMVEETAEHLNSNPFLFWHPIENWRILGLRHDGVVSYNRKIQNWYANNVRHLENFDF